MLRFEEARFANLVEQDAKSLWYRYQRELEDLSLSEKEKQERIDAAWDFMRKKAKKKVK